MAARQALLLAALGAAPVLAWAQTPGPASDSAAARPGANPPPSAAPPQHTDGATEVRLGARLRCPVCQGMSIGDSPSPMAQDMMKQVRRMHAEGMSEADIVTYFTDRYGTWVLLDPPKRGFALWAWGLPPAGLLAGLAFVVQRSRHAARATRGATAMGPSPALSADDRSLLERARRAGEQA